MKFKGTIFLALCCLALLAVVLFLDKGPKKTGEEKKSLFLLDEAKIARITVTEGETVIAAIRGDRKWTLEQPVAAPANKDEWNTMASTLSTLEYDQVIDEKGQNPAAFGLTRPAIVVTFEGEKGRLNKLELGDNSPTGNFVYARVGNNPKIYLISQYSRDKFKADLARLRDNTALAFDANSLQSFTVQRPDQTLQGVKKNYNWFLETPLKCRLDDTEVDNLLRACGDQKVVDHLDTVAPAERKTALGPVRYRLSVRGEKGEQQVLEIGSTSPFNQLAGEVMAYNVTRDNYFTLPQTFVGLMDTPLDKLRNYSVAEFYPFEVSGITVQANGVKQILAKNKENAWRLVGPGTPVDLDSQKVEDYLGAVRDLKVKEFVDAPAGLAAYGLENPAVKIILDIENKTGATILIGARQQDMVFARNPEYSSVLRLAAADWEKIRFQPDAWKKAAAGKK